MRLTPRVCRSAGVLAGLSLVVLPLAGCSGTIVDSEAPSANLGCIDDSRECIGQRQSALQAMLADKSRKWVREPATMGSYATGVRLWAFRSEKARLTCDELGVGRREADNAPGALRGPSSQGIPAGVRARGVIFAEEVAKELTREAQRRCRA